MGVGPGGPEGASPSQRRIFRPQKRDSSVKPPDKLKDTGDAQEDLAAVNDAQRQYMNQSVFSLIAAAGSKRNFADYLNESSSDSEDGEDTQSNIVTERGIGGPSSIPTTEQQGTGPVEPFHHDDQPDLAQSQNKAPPKLTLETRSPSEQHMIQSTILQPSQGPPPGDSQSSIENQFAAISIRAPVMSRMIEAQAGLSNEGGGETEAISKAASLAQKLQEIFGFKSLETVVAEYSCWLMQSVLLQGYMYITRGHISFYAYLPKKSNAVAKSGYLSKRGQQNPKYRRYWFILKGDVLSYFVDQANRYFPSGSIDLRYGISATITGLKERNKETKDFSVMTDQRTYHFRADTPSSARDWVKMLQKVIFRSHNDGDSVKISLPVENIIDTEESLVIDFAETVKLRVVESDETYAIDEYFFAFFDNGKEAFKLLCSMVEGTPAQRIPASLLASSNASPINSREPSTSPAPYRFAERRDKSPSTHHPHLQDQVRATLSPALGGSGSLASSPQRASLDTHRRSADLSPRATDGARAGFNRSIFEKSRRSASTSRTRADERLLETASPAPDSRHAVAITTPDVSDTKTPGAASHVDANLHLSQVQDPVQWQVQEIHESQMPDIVPRGRSAEVKEVHALGAYKSSLTSPLQKAAEFAGFLRRKSQRASSAIGSESTSYVEKMSDMWAGDPKHYDEKDSEAGLATTVQHARPLDAAGAAARFRTHFALPESEKLRASYYCYLHRVLPLYGKIYLSTNFFCFRSLLPGIKTKMILPLKDLETINKEKGFRFGYSGLVAVIQGHEELFFEFTHHEIRDDCAVLILKTLADKTMTSPAHEDADEAGLAMEEYQALQKARNDSRIEAISAADNLGTDTHHPVLFDDPRASILNFKPNESLRITCLTIGSRGDVQPYIALCKGLLNEGHKVKIATHQEFEPWIRRHGINFAPVEGDPARLMALCVDYGVFTYSFLREASTHFRGWIDSLLSSAWTACQDTDLLIESPSAMAGIHIAEAMSIPYFRAFSMPWTRTRAYPHAFVVPEHKMGGAYNYLTYVMFENVFWKAIAGQVNRWRKKTLGLRSTNLERLQPTKVPFLYSFSPSVVVPPLDFSDWVRITGYWFLDEGFNWTPPEDLLAFITQARKDEKKLVYIGFGSIVVSDPTALTKTVIDSVLKADVRCILSKGWSDRLGGKNSHTPEVPLPPELFLIKSAPHDWLFAQIDAAVHHGGAGTTGASLRAGLPTIIKPFFGDQFFFGSRVEDLGVGICLRKLNVSKFSRGLWEVTNSQRMIDKARVLGVRIRSEDGVGTAIQALYRDLEYAKSLIKRQKDMTADDDACSAFDEETWTMIGDESDPELQRKIRDWQPPWERDPEGSRTPTFEESRRE